jgi:hypothetical protein
MNSWQRPRRHLLASEQTACVQASELPSTIDLGCPINRPWMCQWPRVFVSVT